MKTALTLALCLLTASAHADAFFKLVGYQCDRQSDRLVLTYDAAANGAGQSMLAAKTATQWDPWSLIRMKDEDNIGSTNTIRATCRLSDGVYSIELGPIPGNTNIVDGRCGAWISAWAEVRLGETVVFPRTDFESGVGCSFVDGEVTTRVEIAPGRAEHTILTVPTEQLLSDTSPMLPEAEATPKTPLPASSHASLFRPCDSIGKQEAFDALTSYFAGHPGKHSDCLALARNEFVFTTNGEFEDCRIDTATNALACRPWQSAWFPDLELTASFSGAGKTFELFHAEQLRSGVFGESYGVFFLVPKRIDPRGYRIVVLDGAGAHDQSDRSGDCAAPGDLQLGQAVSDVVRAGRPPFEILRDGHADVTIRFNQQTVRCATGKIVDSTIAYRWSGNRFTRTRMTTGHGR